jgi:hypothetical protein
MLAALITHPGDRQLTLRLCQQIHKLGGVSHHEALIVAPFGTDMTGIEDVLRLAFGRVETHFYRDTLKGWPYGPNEAAGEAMMHIAANPALLYHYLMLEPDCIPVSPRWLDMIDVDYRRSGSLMLGVRLDTVEIDTRRVVGKHTVGVAVYPKDFATRCPLVRGLRDMSDEYRRQNAMPMPWDAYFGPYTAKMTAETTLIQHLSRVRTVDEKGVHWDCHSVENAMSQVRLDAVLIHGCKNPEFFTRLTGTTYAQTSQSQHPKEPVRSEETRLVRQDRVDPRQESGQQRSQGNGVHQPGEPFGEALDKYSKIPKVRAKQIAKEMAQAKEMGIVSQIGTPQYRRECHFHHEVKWADVRAYALKNLRLKAWGKTKGALIAEIVAKEVEEMKEPWTKVLQPPAAPLPVEEAPLETENFGVSKAANSIISWQDAGEAETALQASAQAPNSISPAQQERMRQLMADRRAAGVL